MVGHIIDRLNRIMRTNITGVTADTMKILKNYHWPGNVRELENVLERAVNFVTEGSIKPVHIPSHLLRCDMTENDGVAEYAEETLVNRLRQAERDVILEALEKTGGNKSRTAKLLNVSRAQLYIKMEKLGIKPARNQGVKKLNPKSI